MKQLHQEKYPKAEIKEFSLDGHEIGRCENRTW